MVERLKFSPTRSRKFRQWSKPIPIHMEDALSPELQNLRSEMLVHKLLQEQVEKKPDERHRKLFENDEHKEAELQKAMRHEGMVTIPDVETIDEDRYSKLYPIRLPGPAEMVDGIREFCPRITETERRTYPLPDSDDDDYDLDSEDEKWMEDNKLENVTAFQFEAVVAQLNKLNIADPKDAKLMSIRAKLPISEDEDLLKIFGYWANKKANSMYSTLKIPKIEIGTSPPNKWKQVRAYAAFCPKYSQRAHRRSTVESKQTAYKEIYVMTKQIKGDLEVYQDGLTTHIQSGMQKKSEILKKIATIETNYTNYDIEDMPMLSVVSPPPERDSTRLSFEIIGPPLLCMEDDDTELNLTGDIEQVLKPENSMVRSLSHLQIERAPTSVLDPVRPSTPKSLHDTPVKSSNPSSLPLVLTTPEKYSNITSKLTPVKSSCPSSLPLELTTPDKDSNVKSKLTPVKSSCSSSLPLVLTTPEKHPNVTSKLSPVKSSTSLPLELTTPDKDSNVKSKWTPVKSSCSSSLPLVLTTPEKYSNVTSKSTPVKSSCPSSLQLVLTTPEKHPNVTSKLSPVKSSTSLPLELTTPDKDSNVKSKLTPVKSSCSSSLPLELTTKEKYSNVTSKLTPVKSPKSKWIQERSLDSESKLTPMTSSVFESKLNPVRLSNSESLLSLSRCSNSKSKLTPVMPSNSKSKLILTPFISESKLYPYPAISNSESVLSLANSWYSKSKLIPKPFISESKLHPYPAKLSNSESVWSLENSWYSASKNTPVELSGSTPMPAIAHSSSSTSMLTPVKLSNSVPLLTFPANSIKSASTETPVKRTKLTPSLTPIRLSISPPVTPVKLSNLTSVQAVPVKSTESEPTHTPIKLSYSESTRTPVKNLTPVSAQGKAVPGISERTREIWTSVASSTLLRWSPGCPTPPQPINNIHRLIKSSSPNSSDNCPSIISITQRFKRRLSFEGEETPSPLPSPVTSTRSPLTVSYLGMNTSSPYSSPAKSMSPNSPSKLCTQNTRRVRVSSASKHIQNTRKESNADELQIPFDTENTSSVSQRRKCRRVDLSQ